MIWQFQVIYPSNYTPLQYVTFIMNGCIKVPHLIRLWIARKFENAVGYISFDWIPIYLIQFYKFKCIFKGSNAGNNEILFFVFCQAIHLWASRELIRPAIKFVRQWNSEKKRCCKISIKRAAKIGLAKQKIMCKNVFLIAHT